jgi:ABC-2 type transport system permease protein
MTRTWWTMTWLVAVREMRDRTRAKSFWVASVLLLVAVAAGAVIPAVLQGKKATALVGIVGSPVTAQSQAAHQAGLLAGVDVTVTVLPDLAAARTGLRSGRLAAVLVHDSEVLVKQQAVGGSKSGGLAATLADVAGLRSLYGKLPPSAAAAVAAHGIALPVHGLLPPPRNLSTRFTGLAAAILIYVIILTYGIRITISVGEEKATRVIEVLLTTLRPVQLLAGKVIGTGLLALAQIAAMIGVYLALGHALGSNSLHGASLAVVLQTGLWLVLGYAFYCTAYAAAGSLITRQADAYNAALPLQIPLILAYVLANTVIYASSVNVFYHVLAFIPFTAPVAMPVLVAVGAAPAWQIAISAVIILASTVVMARAAGTVYERAILRTGSRLKVREVLATAS